MRMLKYHVHASLLLIGALPIAVFAGGGPVNRTVPADAAGEVEISNVSGTIDVRGWDRSEVQVTGELGDDVERLDVESSGGLRPNDFGEGERLDCWIGRVDGLETAALPDALAQWECRNNRLAWLGLGAEGLLDATESA